MRAENRRETGAGKLARRDKRPIDNRDAVKRGVAAHLSHDHGELWKVCFPRFQIKREMFFPAGAAVVDLREFRPPVEPVEAERSPRKTITDIGPLHDEVMTMFFFLRVDDVNLTVPPKHRQVTVTYILRHAHFSTKSVAFEPTDKSTRCASLMVRRSIDDNFH